VAIDPSFGLFILPGNEKKQRIIPAMAKPRNDSTRICKNNCRLYYEKKGDNKNLCYKMIAYFLSTFVTGNKLSTSKLR